MKSYTDIEQSKKLAEILPIESADMRYGYIAPYDYSDRMYDGGYDEVPYPKDFLKKNPNFSENEYDGELPAWSITALMSVFPKEEGSCTSISFGYYDANGNYINSWLCCYEKEGESTDDYIIETILADNPVDCCYEMILKLKEQNLL